MSLFSFKFEDIRQVGLKDYFSRLYTKAAVEEDLLSSAAQVAYFFAFALFPLLLFLISLFGLVLESTNDLRTELFFYLRQVMPGSASDLVQKTIEEVTQSSSGGKLTFGILVALYSASAGVDSIRIALNGVYNQTESRPWWKTKLTSLLITLISAILITIALGIIFYGSKFLTLLLDWINLPIPSPFFLGILQGVTVLVVLIATFALLYNYLPSHSKPSWVWITPGAIAGIVLWLAVSFAFRLYLNYFNTYDKTYGSLGAVIILMLWLYLTALVILIGGSMNAVLQEITDPDTAAAGEKKAVAKEIVNNPEAEISLDKKVDLFHKTTSSPPNAEEVAAPNAPPVEPPPKTKIITAAVKDFNSAESDNIGRKPAVSLVVGTVFGFMMGLFYLKKKDD